MLVTGRSIGSRKPLFADWSIPLTPEWGDGGELTLRELIERLVAAEVRRFNERLEERRLDRVLSEEQIEEGRKRGRVSPEGRSRGPAAEEEWAVAAALQAFEDGLYLVVIDEVEFRDLEQPVRLGPESRIVFIRLTFLAGA